MKKHGTIVHWDKERASGFIRSPDTAAQVYFHLRDYEGPHPVTPGTAVVFEEIVIGGKGPRALSIKLPPPPPLQSAGSTDGPAPEPVLAPAAVSKAQRWREERAQRRQTQVALGLLGGWLLLWLVGIGAGRFPWVVLTGVVLVNIATLFLFFFEEGLVVVRGDCGVRILLNVLQRLIAFQLSASSGGGLVRVVRLASAAGRLFFAGGGRECERRGRQLADRAADWAGDRIAVQIVQPCAAFTALAGALGPARFVRRHGVLLTSKIGIAGSATAGLSCQNDLRGCGAKPHRTPLTCPPPPGSMRSLYMRIREARRPFHDACSLRRPPPA